MFKFLINLRLFDGEGSGDSGTASAAGEQTGEQTTSAADSTDEGITTTSNTLEEKRKAFKDLVNSEEWKDMYTEETQKMINRRFKQTKELEEQVNSYKPLVDMLTQRYGIQDGKVDSIIKALEDDNAMWEAAADEAGMSVDQYKRVQKLERENKALLEAQSHQKEQAMIDAQMNQWMQEAEQLKAKYPGFDMDTELVNPNFQRLLSSGISMSHAYEVLHMEEILNSTVKNTADMTQKNVVENIRARGSRPIENGLSSQNAFQTKSDVTKLTKKDREELAERARRGEIISF